MIIERDVDCGVLLGHDEVVDVPPNGVLVVIHVLADDTPVIRAHFVAQRREVCYYLVPKIQEACTML